MLGVCFFRNSQRFVYEGLQHRVGDPNSEIQTLLIYKNQPATLGWLASTLQVFSLHNVYCCTHYSGFLQRCLRSSKNTTTSFLNNTAQNMTMMPSVRASQKVLHPSKSSISKCSDLAKCTLQSIVGKDHGYGYPTLAESTLSDGNLCLAIHSVQLFPGPPCHSGEGIQYWVGMKPSWPADSFSLHSKAFMVAGGAQCKPAATFSGLHCSCSETNLTRTQIFSCSSFFLQFLSKILKLGPPLSDGTVNRCQPRAVRSASSPYLKPPNRGFFSVLNCTNSRASSGLHCCCRVPRRSNKV